ncbi:MAG: VWA domain-containing protein, partial [Thermomicrobiales bacterium]|nr:VWA domain-containing protein [Thermomicrobiales bacterium]
MPVPGIFRRLTIAGSLLAVLLLSVLTVGAIAAQDDEESADNADSQIVNVEIILDASGSMAEEIEPGVTRIDAAKTVLRSIIGKLPQSDNVNIGVRVYGHKGANNETGRAESCLSTDLMVPVLGTDRELLSSVVDNYQPVGWTPLTLALQSSELDFPETAENQINTVVLMTDGLETCGGDPCTIAGQLHNGPKAITTNVIGFALAPDEEKALQCVADQGGGVLIGAATAVELNEAMTILLSDLDLLNLMGMIEIEQVAGIFPAATVTGGPEATTLTPDPEVISVAFEDENVIQVPEGTYAVAWSNETGEEISIDVFVRAGETSLIRGSLVQLPISPITPYLVTAVDGTVVWNGPVTFGDAI